MYKRLKKKILKIGPENICAFVAETIMGGLVGDVPPTKNYWKRIRELCNKFDIHLICDEIWCGAGTTGKNFSIDWDNVTPDFVTFENSYFGICAIINNNNKKILKQNKR